MTRYSKEFLMKLYRTMLTIRLCEEKWDITVGKDEGEEAQEKEVPEIQGEI